MDSNSSSLVPVQRGLRCLGVWRPPSGDYPIGSKFGDLYCINTVSILFGINRNHGLGVRQEINPGHFLVLLTKIRVYLV